MAGRLVRQPTCGIPVANCNYDANKIRQHVMNATAFNRAVAGRVKDWHTTNILHAGYDASKFWKLTIPDWGSAAVPAATRTGETPAPQSVVRRSKNAAYG